MQWSNQQDDALTQVSQWLKRGDGQVFRLFGYAGTGKTTLARHLAEGIDGTVVFASFTGKAAHVLRQKGCPGASTLHSLIYRPRGGDEEGPTFALNRDSKAADAALIVIDECSMVDEDLGSDLMSFGTPILVLGDPAQLPPVSGGGYFTEAEPDIMLTEVHRQAADNPIIHLSMLVREGQSLSKGHFGSSAIVSRRDIDAQKILDADQVLVGMNRTRHKYNQRIRSLMGFGGETPESSDKLVCLRNDKSRGLLNGSLWTVQRLRSPKKDLIRFDVRPEEEPNGRSVTVQVHPDLFSAQEPSQPRAIPRRSDAFDYGYAMTVHKAQGSQWDNLVLFDESGAFREHRSRWLYTGLTRAAETITVVL